MTTPAHCTRTDPHPAHAVWATSDEASDYDCPGVESPADVAATPDPRLDVVADVLRDAMGDAADDPDDFALTQRILDALDAMRPDEHIPAGTRDPRLDGRELAFEVYSNAAPAGLTPAQQIRLRIAEAFDDPDPDLPMLGRLAAWVEHGPDETPEDTSLAQYTEQVMRLSNFIIDEIPGEPSRSEGAVDCAIRLLGLYGARLGHIADALRDVKGGTLDMASFVDAADASLNHTPDDTATHKRRVPHLDLTDDQGRPIDEPDDTAPADTATGDE